MVTSPSFKTGRRTTISALALIICVLVRATQSAHVLSPTWVPKKEVERLTKLLQGDSRFKEIHSLMRREGSGRGQQSFLSYLEAVLAAGSRTIFLPTDFAYSKLSPATKTKLKSGSFIQLQQALQLLTVKTKLANSQLLSLQKGATMATASGSILVKLDDKNYPKSIVLGAVGSAGKANIVVPDFLLSPALSVHVIDFFLTPQKF